MLTCASNVSSASGVPALSASPFAWSSKAPRSKSPRVVASRWSAPDKRRGARAGNSGASSASWGASKRDGKPFGVVAALPVAVSRADASFTSIAASRTTRGAKVPRSVPDERDAGELAARGDRDLAATRHAGSSAPFAATSPSSLPAGNLPKREGSTCFALAWTSNARRPARSIGPLPASSPSPARIGSVRRRACARRPSPRTTLRCRRRCAIGEAAFDPLARRPRSAPSDPESRVVASDVWNALQVDVAHVERPLAGVAVERNSRAPVVRPPPSIRRQDRRA